MSVFEEDRGLDNNNKEEDGKGLSILSVIFVIIVLPVILIAYLIYGIFFKGLKWRPKYSIPIVVPVGLLFGLILYFWERAMAIPRTPAVLINLYYVAGVIFGIIYIIYQAHNIKKHPEMRLMPGALYNFKYNSSPSEKRKLKKIIANCKDGEYISTDAAPLGVLVPPVVLEDGLYENVEPVFSYYEEANKSRLITGLPGSGKTVTMLNLMYNDVKVGFPLIVMDFKKGTNLAYHLSKWAKENGRQFYHFVSGPKGGYSNPYCKYQASYDPLSTGDATAKADMILSIREWDGASEVYKQRTQSAVQSVFYLLERVDQKEVQCIPWKYGGLPQLIEALKLVNLKEMVMWLERDINKRKQQGGQVTQGELMKLNELIEVVRDLSTPKSILREQFEGIQVICRNLIMSNYSDWLYRGETPYHINLFDIITSDKGPIVLFQFNPNEEPEFAKYMGGIILADLQRAAAMKQAMGNKKMVGVYIDEFQSLNPNSVISMIEKVREPGFFTTFSAQTTNQITKAVANKSEETLLALFENINTFIIHAGATETTAENLAKIVGKTIVRKYTVGSTRKSSILGTFGNFSRSRNNVVHYKEEEDYRIPPQEFQKLSAPSKSNNFRTEAYCIVRNISDPDFADRPEAIARKVVIVPNDEVLEPVPEEFKQCMNQSMVQRIKRKHLSEIQEWYVNDSMPTVQDNISNSANEDEPTGIYDDNADTQPVSYSKTTEATNIAKPTVRQPIDTKKTTKSSAEYELPQMKAPQRRRTPTNNSVNSSSSLPRKKSPPPKKKAESTIQKKVEIMNKTPNDDISNTSQVVRKKKETTWSKIRGDK